jgi:hypothetical protein
LSNAEHFIIMNNVIHALHLHVVRPHNLGYMLRRQDVLATVRKLCEGVGNWE